MAKKSEKVYTRKDFEERPVTPKDKWCRIGTKSKGSLEAPYGYIITIPDYFDGMVVNLCGSVLRNHIDDKGLHVQVVGKKKSTQYKIEVNNYKKGKKSVNFKTNLA